MRITVNGADQEIDHGAMLSDVLDDRSGVAVALNDEVVPRARVLETALTDGDRVEIVTAVQGG